MAWWAAPDVVIIPARATRNIIEWLNEQDSDTWHNVVMSWNYDYGDEVLSWILKQDECDRGTAARIFLVEGLGRWLGDEQLANDRNHLCHIALSNWQRYKRGELHHGLEIPHDRKTWVNEVSKQACYANMPIQNIMNFTGKREAVSKYGSDDGKIVVAFKHWIKTQGIVIT